jgi:hypothetical protein
LPWSECSMWKNWLNFVHLEIFVDHHWNTKACSTVNTRRDFIGNCMNQLNNTLNTTDISLESNFLYENCSKELTRLRFVSPAQEYFQ